MSQQTIVAVAITLAVVAVILVVVLLWPLGRLGFQVSKNGLALCVGVGSPREHIKFIPIPHGAKKSRSAGVRSQPIGTLKRREGVT